MLRCRTRNTEPFRTRDPRVPDYGIVRRVSSTFQTSSRFRRTSTKTKGDWRIDREAGNGHSSNPNPGDCRDSDTPRHGQARSGVQKVPGVQETPTQTRGHSTDPGTSLPEKKRLEKVGAGLWTV